MHACIEKKIITSWPTIYCAGVRIFCGTLPLRACHVMRVETNVFRIMCSLITGRGIHGADTSINFPDEFLLTNPLSLLDHHGLPDDIIGGCTYASIVVLLHIFFTVNPGLTGGISIIQQAKPDSPFENL